MRIYYIKKFVSNSKNRRLIYDGDYESQEKKDMRKYQPLMFAARKLAYEVSSSAQEVLTTFRANHLQSCCH
jgi:hypothetical protein